LAYITPAGRRRTYQNEGGGELSKRKKAIKEQPPGWPKNQLGEKANEKEVRRIGNHHGTG